jgi:hypothetical protein
VPEEIDLNDAEEAALERAWARVGPTLADDAAFASDPDGPQDAED